MSARKWRDGAGFEPGGVDGSDHYSSTAGSGGAWCAVYSFVCQPWTATGQTGDGWRTWTETGIPTEDEAKALASEWLDRREAEAQQAQKGGTT